MSDSLALEERSNPGKGEGSVRRYVAAGLVRSPRRDLNKFRITQNRRASAQIPQSEGTEATVAQEPETRTAKKGGIVSSPHSAALHKKECEGGGLLSASSTSAWRAGDRSKRHLASSFKVPNLSPHHCLR